MATELEQLLVRIDASTEAARRELKKMDRSIQQSDRRVSRAQKSIESSFKKIGVAIAAAFTVNAVKNFTRFNIQAASDAEELRSKFNVVFGDMASEVEAWAKTTADALNRSGLDLMQYASELQDTFVPMGFARDQAAQLSKQLTTLAVDVASFNNQADSDVLRDFQSALVGNTETVRKYGIVITQSRLSQELLNMGIAGGANKASEAEKILGRYNLILAGTKDAQGDASRTSGSFANQLKGLEAASRDAAVAIGQSLMPIAAELVGILKDIAIAVEDAFTPDAQFDFGEALEENRRKVEKLRRELERLAPGGRRANVESRIKALQGRNPEIVRRQLLSEIERKTAELENAGGELQKPERTVGRTQGGRLGLSPSDKRRIKLTDQLKELNAQLELVTKSMADADAAKNKLLGTEGGGDIIAPTKDTSAEDEDKLSKRLKKQNEELERQAEIIRKQVMTPAEEYAAQIAHLVELALAGKLSQETYNRALRQAKEAYESASKAAEKNANKINQTFIDIRINAEEGFDGIVDSLERTLQRMAEMILESELMSLMENLFDFDFDGSGGVGDGGLFKGLLGFAKGGTPPVGVPSVVGEEGPELFIPKVPGTVIPARQTAQMLNGGPASNSVVQHINFNTDRASVKEMIAEEVPRIRDLVLADLANQSMRGTPTGRAIRG